MSATCTCTTEVLELKLSEMLGAFIGRGGTPGNVQIGLKVEAGQIAFRIAQALGPKTKASGAKSIARDVKKVLSPRHNQFNLNRKEYKSKYDMNWLSAGPNFLAGVAREDDLTGASVNDALALVRASQRGGIDRGNAWREVDMHGPQHVKKLERFLVSSQTFNGTIKIIAKRLGESKAAWLRTAVRYLKRQAGPGWVLDQIPAVTASGKSILNSGNEDNRLNPSIEFGSSAPGISSNEKMVAKVQKGLEGARMSLQSKMNKIIAGQTYNWNTGQVFPQVKIEETE